jgi:hypothetical protein
VFEHLGLIPVATVLISVIDYSHPSPLFHLLEGRGAIG